MKIYIVIYSSVDSFEIQLVTTDEIKARKMLDDFNNEVGPSGRFGMHIEVWEDGAIEGKYL